MATIISNQASISYRYGTIEATAVSNVATAVIGSQLEIEKTALTESYRLGQDVTYVITVSNNSTVASQDLVITDNLGSYDFNGVELTPLTYLGPAQLFINGAFDSLITPTETDAEIAFSIDELPAGGNLQIIYRARVNAFASEGENSTIVNTASVEGGCICCGDAASDSATITVEDFADVRIVKTVCPNPVICGEDVAFVIEIQNYGNIPATDVVLTDTFMPPLEDITVTLNGVAVPEANYDYVGGVLTLPNGNGNEITVPAAEFVRNEQTNEFSAVPGRVIITIKGIQTI